MNSTALKERIRAIADGKGVTYNEVWKQIILERFLARLSKSEYQDKFIFKGGLLLAQYLNIGRETTDADFLISNIKGEAKRIESTIKQVAKVELSDGFMFSFSKISELRQPHMDYPGFRLSLNAAFEKMKDKFQIDIGVGDAVDPVENNFRPFEYKGKPMFAGEISILVYPVETIFAEKLETIISKGASNSRMKDYHDIVLMIREPDLINPKQLQTAVIATFRNRGTNFLLPIKFDDASLSSLQRLWSNHLNGLGKFKAQLQLPEKIQDVLAESNAWLARHVGSV